MRQLSQKIILRLMAVKCGKVLGACVPNPEIVTRAAPTSIAVPTNLKFMVLSCILAVGL